MPSTVHHGIHALELGLHLAAPSSCAPLPICWTVCSRAAVPQPVCRPARTPPRCSTSTALCPVESAFLAVAQWVRKCGGEQSLKGGSAARGEKFAIIGSQTCGFRYNRIPNICFAITTLETLTVCYYNIMAFK